MTPSLPKKAREQTEASPKAAKGSDYVRKPRKPLTRKQRYTRNKGLVGMKMLKGLQSM